MKKLFCDGSITYNLVIRNEKNNVLVTTTKSNLKNKYARKLPNKKLEIKLAQILFSEGGVEEITTHIVVTIPESKIEIHFFFHLE